MSDIFGKYFINDFYRKAAIDILAKIKPIRQGINKHQTARRLIWELIQNAKDNVAICNESDKTHKIEINLTESEFKFSHNKGYFKNENIRAIITRFSSSDKEDNEEETLNIEVPLATGQFGTGFMTTHLLSEKVDIEGVFQTENREFKNLRLNLDRTGQNISQIITGIESAFASVEKSVSESPVINHSNENFKTEFIYHLNKEGLSLSNIAIEELKVTAAYALIKHPNIREIICTTPTDTYCFSINNNHTETVEGTEIIRHELKIGENIDSKYYVSLSKGEMKVIIPIEVIGENYHILPIDKNIPKLFLDFPLIGTEDLNIPFIINNAFFEPSVERDGVSLMGGEDVDTKTNSKIINDAFELFNSFIVFVEDKCEWKDLYNLAKLKKPKEKDWINIEWYNDNIVKPVRETLLSKIIVETNREGRTPIKLSGFKEFSEGTYIDFPVGSTKEIEQKIWSLCNIDEYFILPSREDVHEWSDIIWVKDYKLTLEVLVKWVESKLNLETLSTSLGKNTKESISWLNEVLELISNDEILLSQLNQDKIKILPNQSVNGAFQPKSKLFRDKGINDSLKKAMKTLGSDWCDFLLNLDIKEFEAIVFNPKDQDGIINEINRILIEGKNIKISEACNFITSCFPNENNDYRDNVYNFSKRILFDSIPEKTQLSINEKSIWVNSDKIQVKRIVLLIAEQKSISNFVAKYNFTSEEEGLKWLDNFVSFLDKNDFENLLNLKTSPILPNQNGDFRHKDVLYIDETEKISEDLKDISKLLNYDFRKDLLAKEIFPVLPSIQTIETKAIADKITELIEPKFAGIERNESVKELFRKLYLWFNKNKPVAAQIFEKLYERKHRLVDDDEIATNLEKAELLDNLIEETGLSAKQIKEKLKELLTKPNIAEVLKHFAGASQTEVGLYPEGSEDDIMISSSLTDSSSENSRISISQDAKDIILQELKGKGFNVPDTVKINYTIIEGITNPSGKPIKLVVKSGKAGKIYFNPNEWLALSEADSQLFAVTKGNNVRNITLTDLEKVNDIFHMRFNTSAFAVNTNLMAFANFFRYLKYTHFIFETPESTTDYLKEFGLNQRNISASDLTADDKTLLH